ncbi:MAG TPA: pilus assembly protein PilM, partial [Vicinamibacterales bacterium]|nr:pilus assembly protein PilM [Vicinamibacterales bacterium]
AVALSHHRATRTVSAYASETLPAGAVEPALNAPNVHDAGALAAAIRSTLHHLGGRIRRLALVLPDSVAKVSLIRFDKVPEKASDLEQLIRWQVRKAAPFRIEDAQVTWQPGAASGGGREYLVTVARRDIVQSYEQACEQAGAHAGIVDLASFNLVNAVLASGASSADWLLVHVAADYATLAVVRGGDVVFFRNRSAATDHDLVDLVHQTAMYHEDRLGGGGFGRVVLAGASVLGAAETDRLRRMLEERAGVSVETVDFRSAVTMRDRIAAGPELLDALAPSLGVLLRGVA